MSEAIRATGLKKRFGAIEALKGVELGVNFGEVYGLLGPDGAGKTTLFRILTTLMEADSGRAEVCGFDVEKNYRQIRNISGYMPGRFSLYPDLTVEENLEFYASLFGVGVKDNYAMIAPIYSQLAAFKRRRASKLSGGMKQKLALCCALIHKPEILFLDEPTTGVDAVSRSEFWDILGEIKQTGMPIIVSTPYMDEASRCDRLSLMCDGRMLESGSPREILERNKMGLFAVKGKDNYRTLQQIRAQSGIEGAYLFGEYIHVFTPEGYDGASLRGIAGVEDVKAIEPGIEDVFIKIMSDGKE